MKTKPILSLPEQNDYRIKKATKEIERLGIAKVDKKLSFDEAISELKKGKIQGVIAGATWSSAKTFSKAIKEIGVSNNRRASTVFMLKKNSKNYFFADCALNVKPNEKDLVDITINTIDFVERLGIKPKVAMLSFSTRGSSNHEEAKKVLSAKNMVNKKRPDIMIDGEIQFDAAISKRVAKQKGIMHQEYNVFIFPDLNSGNISYKIMEHMAGYKAIGPITLGLRKPVNDLSRGCGVEDIVEVAKITIKQIKNV